MNSILANWLAQGESWASAVEFAIPRDEWVNYSVLQRDADLYIAAFSRLFDALRLPDPKARTQELAALADGLLLFACDPTRAHVSGVDQAQGLLHTAACAYLAEYAATATLLARGIGEIEDERLEEGFLRTFLSRDLALVNGNPFGNLLNRYVSTQDQSAVESLEQLLAEHRIIGLESDPRQFIAATLALACLARFKEVNLWATLRSGAGDYAPERWQRFFTSAGSTSFPLWEVFPSQMEAIRKGFLQSPPAFSMQMPTSSGKTALCELLIYQEVAIRGGSVLFLVPFRALAAEIQRGLARRLDTTGITVMASFGGNVPTRSEAVSVPTTDVLITTPEKYLALKHLDDAALRRFSLVICDEGHLIDDQDRGLHYELLLTRLRSDESARNRRFVFLSAIIPNIDTIQRWLGGDIQHVARSDYRPVRVDYGLIASDGRAFTLQMNPHLRLPERYYLKRFIARHDAQYQNLRTRRLNTLPKWNSHASLACLAALKAAGTGSVAVFTTTRGIHGVSGLTNALLRMLDSQVRAASHMQGITPDADVTAFSTFLLGNEHQLSRLVERGCALHHGHLPQELRRAVEESVEAGRIRLVVCTNTLAEGVNLPIRTIVIHTARRFDVDAGRLRYIPRRSIKNIAGRAGRAGKERRGRVIFANERERSFALDVMGDIHMEEASGLLLQLVRAIHSHLQQHNQILDQGLFDMDDLWLQDRLDEIDYVLLELVPVLEQSHASNDTIDAILDRTLAVAQNPPAEISQCLRNLFRLRVAWLQERVGTLKWEVLRRTGTPPRLFDRVDAAGALAHPLWTTLADSVDDRWLDEVVLPLLPPGTVGEQPERAVVRQLLTGWMSGATYVEMAHECEIAVDSVLDIMTGIVGFQLQHVMSKVCQLAAERPGCTDLALQWASLAQYGVRNCQQLDLMDHGFTDRLAVWGISRHLDATGRHDTGEALSAWVRSHSQQVVEALKADARVPVYSIRLFEREVQVVVA